MRFGDPAQTLTPNPFSLDAIYKTAGNEQQHGNRIGGIGFHHSRYTAKLICFFPPMNYVFHLNKHILLRPLTSTSDMNRLHRTCAALMTGGVESSCCLTDHKKSCSNVNTTSGTIHVKLRKTEAIMILRNYLWSSFCLSLFV